MPVFDCWIMLGELKEIVPTAPIQVDRQFCLADIVSDLVPLFKTAWGLNLVRQKTGLKRWETDQT